MTTPSPEQLAQMSDAEIDAMISKQLESSDTLSLLAETGVVDTSKIEVPSGDTPEDAAPATAAPADALVIHDPMTGKLLGDEPVVEVDPDSIPDDAVGSSITDHTSSVDHAALAAYYGDPEDDEDDADTGAFGEGGFAPEPEDGEGDDEPIPDDEPETQASSFMPQRPVVPDADDDAAPTLEPVSLAESRSFDAAGKARGALTAASGGTDKAKKWFSGQSTRNKALMGAAAVFVLLFGIIAVSRGDGDDEPAPRTADAGHGAVETQEPDTGTDVPGKPVVLNDKIKSVSAKCADPSTSPTLAFSADKSDAWVCTRSHGIDGSVMNITFTEPVTIHEISMVPGFDYIRQPSGDDSWDKHRVVTRVLWRMGGRQINQQIAPSRSQAILNLDTPITTQEMSLTIQASEETDGAGDGALFSEEGTAADATAIQNIEIVGTVD